MAGLCLPDAHCVSMAWRDCTSSPAIMARAWAAAGQARGWDQAYGAARMCGAVPEDASLTADAADASLSPNATREAWVAAVETLTAVSSAEWGDRCSDWLLHASTCPDPRAGVRMAAGAARAHLAGCPAPLPAAHHFLRVLHAGCRPRPELAAAACGLDGFAWMGRWYLR